MEINSKDVDAAVNACMRVYEFITEWKRSPSREKFGRDFDTSYSIMKALFIVSEDIAEG